ncbi:MAG: SDR family oxidoreductase [Saprospiraceae bacterium]|nr:SDR family oxidoreductase [Saprospiraceae bacterium]
MDQKNYLLIGGSTGIGFSLAKKLSAAGHTVTVCSRTSGELHSLPGVDHFEMDILKDEIPEGAISDNLHGMVYLPGSINLKPFRSLKPADFQADFEINVLGAIKAIQAAEGKLRKTPGSAVVLFSTVAVQQGMPYHASVAASKGAVEGIVRSLAAEWAPKVRLNAIAPSLTDTPLASRLLSNEDRKNQSADRHPLKRVGTPEDIANLAHFLLSDESAWITGQVMAVDGGIGALKV